MSIQVGLSASEDDLEVQGEIDFDFFDNSDKNKKGSNDFSADVQTVNHVLAPEVENGNEATDNTEDNVRKSVVETVIPSPEDYLGNNCGVSPSASDKNQQDDSDLSSSLSTSASDASASLTDESLDKFEDTDSMTDVTPLTSHCTSPLVQQSDNSIENAISNLHARSPSASPTDNSQKKERVKFLDKVKATRTQKSDAVDVDTLLKAIKTLRVKQVRSNGAPLQTANSRHRKNLSFTNEDVRRIDQENQRLLKKITLQQNRSKPHYAATTSKPANSTINRQRQQRQIELDNLALLKRLETSKASRDLSRLHLLKEYDHRSPVSSRASLRSTSRVSSQLSSCRSSARSGSRSSLMSSQCPSKPVRVQSSSSTKVRKASTSFSSAKT